VWRCDKPIGDLPMPSSLPGGSLRGIVLVRVMSLAVELVVSLAVAQI
jgi:hypothetical protein